MLDQVDFSERIFLQGWFVVSVFLLQRVLATSVFALPVLCTNFELGAISAQRWDFRFRECLFARICADCHV